MEKTLGSGQRRVWAVCVSGSDVVLIGQLGFANRVCVH